MKKEKNKSWYEMLYGKNCEEWLNRWDSGQTVWTVEMGGFGPGYEQAIQIAMVAILRYYVENQIPKESFIGTLMYQEMSKKRDNEMNFSVLSERLGLSGAQEGAAANLAKHIYVLGPVECFNDPETNKRLIQISKNFPQA